jgi:hypothetical protein
MTSSWRWNWEEEQEGELSIELSCYFAFLHRGTHLLFVQVGQAPLGVGFPCGCLSVTPAIDKDADGDEIFAAGAVAFKL